jgi:hypothetical protein
VSSIGIPPEHETVAIEPAGFRGCVSADGSRHRPSAPHRQQPDSRCYSGLRQPTKTDGVDTLIEVGRHGLGVFIVAGQTSPAPTRRSRCAPAVWNLPARATSEDSRAAQPHCVSGHVSCNRRDSAMPSRCHISLRPPGLQPSSNAARNSSHCRDRDCHCAIRCWVRPPSARVDRRLAHRDPAQPQPFRRKRVPRARGRVVHAFQCDHFSHASFHGQDVVDVVQEHRQSRVCSTCGIRHVEVVSCGSSDQGAATAHCRG